MSKGFVYDVCVIGGCGRAGLPLAIAFAAKGKKVAALDVNEDALNSVRGGKMPFKEEGADEMLRKVNASGNLTAGDDPALISQSEHVILMLGTPVSSHLYPQYTSFFSAIRNYLEYFRQGQLVVLRSTVYPGCSEKVHKMFEKSNAAVDLAFCPERIAEGYALKELMELPQIISGFSDSASERARRLFSILTPDTISLAPMEAELAKLFSNVWRYIKFSIPNQFYMIATSHGLDFYKIYRAVTYNEPRTGDMPKAGFTAGPCLFKDTMQLAAFSDNSLFLGHAAMLVNEGMPTYMINRLLKQFNLEDKVVGILGVAFKQESDDERESLAFKLWNSLEKECRQVLAADPYVHHKRLSPLEEVLAKSDLFILAAPHQAYRDLDLRGKPFMDIWGFWNGEGKVI